MSTLEVFRHWQILPPAEEALVRRVSWFKNIFRFPNRQLIVALFGRVKFEEVGDEENSDAIQCDTNPWALRFLEDIKYACGASESFLNVLGEGENITIGKLFTLGNNLFISILGKYEPLN